MKDRTNVILYCRVCNNEQKKGIEIQKNQLIRKNQEKKMIIIREFLGTFDLTAQRKSTPCDVLISSILVAAKRFELLTLRV